MIRKRHARLDDPAILAIVRRELLPFAQRTRPSLRWRPSEVKRRLGRQTTFIAAAPGGRKVTGFATLFELEGDLVLDMLAVDADSQGRGLGTALLRHAEWYGRQRGCSGVRLLVDEENGNARRFYARNGYMEFGYLPSLSCVLLRKPL